ncbi:hypothetical protein DPMN_182763 [Dreissena polymorpha]|uniref:Uncharacterized protein n=1 Tax=Dreissena polymorpha TaxID=45954 RepID=A0A9D4DG41_DREPO|nr:hypothetical protein DPMN_182763 [Dreissena polymorpha]
MGSKLKQSRNTSNPWRESHKGSPSGSSKAWSRNYNHTLTVGWQHNVCLQEKQKPLSFIDKFNPWRAASTAVVDELQMMKDKCSKLETENSELRRQLTEHCSKSKENSSKDKEIEAFWRFEDGREEWLPAKLIRKYANGECSVQYSDGVSRVRSSWVREVGQM